jgi:hypothetical protein
MLQYESHFYEQYQRAVRIGLYDGFRHVLVAPEILDFAFHVADGVNGSGTPLRCSIDARPFSDQTVYYCTQNHQRGVFAFSVVLGPSGQYRVEKVSGDKGLVLGFFTPGGTHEESGPDHFVWFISILLSVMNQPRFVVDVPALSRQVRRQIKRDGRDEVILPRRISWNVGDEVKRGLQKTDPERCMPLHFRRGHWRHAESHYVGAVQRPDALIEEDRVGFWQWIAAQWVGHPAFGFRDSIHSPTLNIGSRLRDGA